MNTILRLIAEIIFFIIISSSSIVNPVNAICVPAALAYGSVSFETGCQLGYGIANTLKLETLLGIPLCILVGVIESVLPTLQGLLAFFLPICVSQFPPVDDKEKAFISETVSTTNGYELGFALGGPYIGLLLGPVITFILLLKSIVFMVVRKVAEVLDTI